MAQQCKFNVGDIVTKRYGNLQAEILPPLPTTPQGRGWPSQYRCRYLHSKISFRATEAQLTLSESATTASIANMKTLYSFTKPDGSTGYGTYLATNSTNQLIVEEKGTGAILTFDKDQLEEVLPYTFAVKVNGKETHYLGNSGSSLKKGDVVMLTDSNSGYSIGRVTGIDTKNRTPREKFNGVKLVTEPI